MEPTQSPDHAQVRIYLAGGFRSGWQDRVIEACPNFNYLDPRINGPIGARDYTNWDLKAISQCDWVFAYLEKDNPGGYSLAVEIGYARALEKLIILVDEKSAMDQQSRRYLEMMRECTNPVFDVFEHGLHYLEYLHTRYGKQLGEVHA